MDPKNQNNNSGAVELDEMQKKLMEELGLSNLPLDKQQELIIKMTEAVLKRVFVETLEKLNEVDREVYSQMIEDGKSPEEIDAFLKEKIANYEELVRETIEKFKAEMKEGAAN
jgi:hypothetical protein